MGWVSRRVGGVRETNRQIERHVHRRQAGADVVARLQSQAQGHLARAERHVLGDPQRGADIEPGFVQRGRAFDIVKLPLDRLGKRDGVQLGRRVHRDQQLGRQERLRALGRLHVPAVVERDAHEDGGFQRFFAWLGLATFAASALVLADDLLVMFLAWQVLAVATHFLADFWYASESEERGGRSAFLVGRIGDAGFLLGVLVLYAGLSEGPEGLASGTDWIAIRTAFAASPEVTVATLRKTSPAAGAPVMSTVTPLTFFSVPIPVVFCAVITSSLRCHGFEKFETSIATARYERPREHD